MAKFKSLFIVASIVLVLAAATLIMNLPIFSSGNIQMDKCNAPDLAKADFEKGMARFIEVCKEEPKTGGSSSRKWVVPGEKQIGEKVLEKYCLRGHIEPDYGKAPKVFKKEESAFAASYNKKMLEFIQANDKTVEQKKPGQAAK
jgi:hypothetical protein